MDEVRLERSGEGIWLVLGDGKYPHDPPRPASNLEIELWERAEEYSAALFRCVELTGEDTSGGIPASPTLPQWAIENVARLRQESDQADEQLSGLWACPWGHVCSVTRVPNAEDVRKCWLCGQVVQHV